MTFGADASGRPLRRSEQDHFLHAAVSKDDNVLSQGGGNLLGSPQRV
jgi:hypothetical protein